MRRISLFAPTIMASMMSMTRSWSPPVYHWHSHPSAPGAKATNAAAIKRQAKKRRNRK